MLNKTGAVHVREFPPVLFYFLGTIAVHLGHFYVLVLWHNTKVGMIRCSACKGMLPYFQLLCLL